MADPVRAAFLCRAVLRAFPHVRLRPWEVIGSVRLCEAEGRVWSKQN